VQMIGCAVILVAIGLSQIVQRRSNTLHTGGVAQER